MAAQVLTWDGPPNTVLELRTTNEQDVHVTAVPGGGGGGTVAPLSATFFGDSQASPIGANGSIANPFPSVQDAIDATTGEGFGSVLLVPGEYLEPPLVIPANNPIAIIAMDRPSGQVLPDMTLTSLAELSLENVVVALAGAGTVDAEDSDVSTLPGSTELVLRARGGQVTGIFRRVDAEHAELDSITIDPVEAGDALYIADCTYTTAELTGPAFDGDVVFLDEGSFSRAIAANCSFTSTPIVQGGVELAGLLGDANASLDSALGTRWVVIGNLTAVRTYTLQVPADETIPTSQIIENSNAAGEDVLVANGGTSGGTHLLPSGFGAVYTWVDPDWIRASVFEPA